MTVAPAIRTIPIPDEAETLAALIGSRICHDLANPVGALANGIELLTLEGASPGAPELALVADSAAHAAARLRFARIAYGIAAPGQILGRSETELVLAEAYAGNRLAVVWGVAGDAPRAEVKLAFLALQCAESAMPRGGEVHVTLAGGRWRIDARGARVEPDPALWALFGGGPLPPGLTPGHVQFALAPRAAQGLGRRIETAIQTDGLSLAF